MSMVSPRRLAIIGGTGLDALPGAAVTSRQSVDTPFGAPSSAITHARVGSHGVLFLARHGDDHDIPPHAVNYRANLWALRDAGADAVIAVNAVGGIRADLVTGTVVMPDQIVDYTSGRCSTYAEAGNGPVRHIDFTRPYDEAVRNALCDAAAMLSLPGARAGAVHAVTQGPRLETAAEVNRLERDGCDIVGMTGMPEAALARELGLAYACCAVVVNRAAGRGHEAIHDELSQALPAAMDRVMAVVGAALDGLAGPPTGG